MSVYQPICTCNHAGINGCAKHTYGPPRALTDLEPVQILAIKITEGQAFTDTDAVRVAAAYLETL